MGLCLAKELRAHNLKIYSDFQLVVNQVNNIYLTRGERMVAYMEKAKGLMKTIPTAKNANANALANLASTKDAKLLDSISVEFLAEPSIK